MPKQATKMESDVREFMEANPRKYRDLSYKPRPYEDLTGREKLEAFLEWNGIIGYEHDIERAMMELGWTPPKGWSVL